jgi:hypothetical protein
MKTILVQMADQRWTSDAVRAACALASNTAARVVVLHLMPVNHIRYLGTDLAITPPDKHQFQQIEAYVAIADEYGVELNVRRMQSVSASDALAQAAEYLDADVVFANVANSRVPVWGKVRSWMFQHQLGERQLFTLDQPAAVSARTPSIKLEDAAHAK